MNSSVLLDYLISQSNGNTLYLTSDKNSSLIREAVMRGFSVHVHTLWDSDYPYSPFCNGDGTSLGKGKEGSANCSDWGALFRESQVGNGLGVGAGSGYSDNGRGVGRGISDGMGSIMGGSEKTFLTPHKEIQLGLQLDNISPTLFKRKGIS